MTNEEIKALMAQLQEQGLEPEEIADGVLWPLYRKGKMSKEDLSTLCLAIGLELAEDFENDDHAEPMEGEGAEGAAEGITKEEAEAAKEIAPGESKEEFQEKVEEAAEGSEEPEAKAEGEEADGSDENEEPKEEEEWDDVKKNIFKM